MQLAAALSGPGSEQSPVKDEVPEEKSDVPADEAVKTMPEMKPESVSPVQGTTVATLRYRWSKTVPTSSSEIAFIRSDSENEPIPLTWTESSVCFYSKEMSVPCGNFSGKLVIDGCGFPVEDLIVKHYTFEVDLFIREDIIEDDVGVNETLLEEEKEEPLEFDILLNKIDTYDDINTNFATYSKMDAGTDGIHASNKYEELIRQQITDKMIDDVEQTEKNGRRTPIGDLSTEPFFDGGQTPKVSESVHGSLGQALQMEGLQSPHDGI
ncbi:hypothetical protein ScPMuIL_013249 [Solemya velum]